MEPQSKKVKLSNAVPAAEVITFHLLKNTREGPAIEDNGSFPPDMTHQLFGEDEEIKGYDGLSIDVFLTPRLQPLLDVKYASKAPGATDLKTPFSATFAAGYFEKKEDFDAALSAEEPLPLDQLGKVVAEEEVQEGSTRLVTLSNLSTASADVKELHCRAQALLFFFVDAASAIDAEDPAWDIYLALERTPDGVELLGFATVYNFYAYPDRCRMRLSQILVLPPHQGRGAGALLLRALSQQAKDRNAVDVTCEDPSEGLQRLRDRLDVQRMLSCDWLQEAAMHCVSTVAALPDASGDDDEERATQAAAELALTPELTLRALRELRVTRQQVIRVWESLLMLLGSQLPQSDKVADAVEGMLLRRARAQVAAAKRDAAGKAVHETDSGFVMVRARGAKHAASQHAAQHSQQQQQQNGGAAHPLLGGPPVEGVSAEEQAEAIEESVEARMEELQQLVGSMTAGLAKARGGQKAAPKL